MTDKHDEKAREIVEQWQHADNVLIRVIANALREQAAAWPSEEESMAAYCECFPLIESQHYYAWKYCYRWLKNRILVPAPTSPNISSESYDFPSLDEVAITMDNEDKLAVARAALEYYARDTPGDLATEALEKTK